MQTCIPLIVYVSHARGFQLTLFQLRWITKKSMRQKSHFVALVLDHSMLKTKIIHQLASFNLTVTYAKFVLGRYVLPVVFRSMYKMKTCNNSIKSRGKIAHVWDVKNGIYQTQRDKSEQRFNKLVGVVQIIKLHFQILTKRKNNWSWALSHFYREWFFFLNFYQNHNFEIDSRKSFDLLDRITWKSRKK